MTWPYDQRDMWHGNTPLTISHQHIKFDAYRSSEFLSFIVCHLTSYGSVIKVQITFWVGYSHTNSPLSKVWCLLVLWKWIIGFVSHGIPWSHDQRDVWYGKWEPLKLSHHCANFDAYMSCGNEDITFLFCHVTSRTHPHDQRGMWLSGLGFLNLSHHFAKFHTYKSSESRDITFLFYHVMLRDQMI